MGEKVQDVGSTARRRVRLQLLSPRMHYGKGTSMYITYRLYIKIQSTLLLTYPKGLFKLSLML